LIFVKTQENIEEKIFHRFLEKRYSDQILNDFNACGKRWDNQSASFLSRYSRIQVELNDDDIAFFSKAS